MSELVGQRGRRRIGVSRFLRDRNGMISPLFGLMIAQLIALLGLAVDFGRIVTVRYQVQAAVDAAALAGARAAQLATTQDPIEAATEAATVFYNQSVPPDYVSSEFTVTPNGTASEFQVSATYWVPTPFLSVMSMLDPRGGDSDAPAACQGSAYSCVQLTTQATALLATSGTGGTAVEVSMMLDVTGSMAEGDGSGSTKMATLKLAAKDAVDILIPDDASAHVRIALAPFAAGVNAGTYASAVTGLAATSGRNKLIPCVIERIGTNSYTDAAPSAANGWIGSNAATNPPSGSSYTGRLGSSDYSRSGNCTSSAPNLAAAIVPLTSTKSTLKTTIDALGTNGGTAGQLGTAWAWYLLSPNWASIWPSDSLPGSYATMNEFDKNGNPMLRKIAILMTDGDYNTQFSSQSSSTQARALCTAMKSAGLVVYSVGFRVSSAAKTLLRGCASSDSHYYDATDGDKLRIAFRDIALKISTLRLSR
ncbi:MAG: pilus assembly protein TadG-related protein [Hyphomicrobiaceae bacterium]